MAGPARMAERVWEDGQVTLTVDGREHTLDVETASGGGRAGLVSAATLAGLDPDPRPMAVSLMLDVHHKGRATVSSGPREKMEADVAKLQGAGLWATMARDS